MVYGTVICVTPEHVQEDQKIMLTISERFEEFASCCDTLIQSILKKFYIR